MIDWSVYFPFSATQLLIAAFSGAVMLAPIIVVRIGYRWAIDILNRVVRLVG